MIGVVKPIIQEESWVQGGKCFPGGALIWRTNTDRAGAGAQGNGIRKPVLIATEGFYLFSPGSNFSLRDLSPAFASRTHLAWTYRLSFSQVRSLILSFMLPFLPFQLNIQAAHSRRVVWKETLAGEEPVIKRASSQTVSTGIATWIDLLANANACDLLEAWVLGAKWLEALAAAAGITWGRRGEDWREMTLLQEPLFPGRELRGLVFKGLLLFCVFRSNLENAIMSTLFPCSLGYSVVCP